VTVKPAEVTTASYQTFTVNVPNEKSIPTVSVKVLMPGDIKNATPTQKAEWQIVKEVEGSGEDVVTKSITWQGGSITDGTRDEFTFSAKTPEKATNLQWKAYQTYADGTVVAWDHESNGAHSHDSNNPNAGPLSITKVIAETAQDSSSKKADQAAADAKVAAERSLYISIAAVVVGIFSIFLATRKNK
jgi:uncharacterized protein YcnI